MNQNVSNDEDLDKNHEPLKWNGWGYEDTEFAISQNGEVTITGSRYSGSGKELPSFRPWVETEFGIELKVVAPSGPKPQSIDDPILNNGWLNDVKGHYNKISFDIMERLQHSHGHTAQEIYELRYGWHSSNRVVDAVVYPGNHDHVLTLVSAAVNRDVVIIPYGGGTSVSHALNPPKGEKRMVISLCMSQMNHIKWINRENMTACIESGIRGVELSKQLEELGLTLGHDPDSAEFSTLGGWIATRASGMKKNKYGNIEDLLVAAKLVTPQGVLERTGAVPRLSAGPDINQIILGSEGTLGVITEAIVKIQPLPECRVYGAIVFPTFDEGVRFMHDVARNRAQPASIRLVDNEQFKFSQSLKPKAAGYLQSLMDLIKKKYITSYHGFDINKIAAVTLVFEGTHAEVKQQQSQVYLIASRYGGIKADSESGKRGYELTFMIAYLRDFAFQMGLISESFETSVPWSQTAALCRRVKERVRKTSRLLKVPGEPFASCRVTQTYDVGACVYFYIAMQFQGLENPVKVFTELEHAAREEILSCGGSISHHHGVGKHRKDFIPAAIGEVGVHVLKGLKESIDPKNIFANGNLI